MSIRHRLKLTGLNGVCMRGDRLKHLRETENLTQADLSSRTGISEVQIWRYEKNAGGEPRADIVLVLAQFFNVSTDYLLGNSDYPFTNAGNDLEGFESQVLAALRRGDSMAAIRVIASESLKKTPMMS